MRYRGPDGLVHMQADMRRFGTHVTVCETDEHAMLHIRFDFYQLALTDDVATCLWCIDGERKGYLDAAQKLR